MCPRCCEQHDERSDDVALCRVCIVELAGSLDHPPSCMVTDQGVDAFGRRYVRVRYTDGVDDHIGVLWADEVDPAGEVNRRA
jgi:hypothetical protein